MVHGYQRDIQWGTFLCAIHRPFTEAAHVSVSLKSRLKIFQQHSFWSDDVYHSANGAAI